MGMLKIIICFTFLIFVVGVASSQSVGYNLDSGETIYKETISKNYISGEDYVYKKTNYIYRQNNIEYLKQDYSNEYYSHKISGYSNSYQKKFSNRYWKSKEKYDELLRQNSHYKKHSSNFWNSYSAFKKSYIGKENSFFEIKKKNCYVNPPTNKLFYFKCSFV
jgi:hypothetical protein